MSKSKAVTKSVNFPAYNLSTRKPDSMVVTDVIHIKSYKKEEDGSRKATGNFRYIIKGTGLNKTGAHLQMSAITNKDEAERISKLLRKDAKVEEPKEKAPCKKRSTKSCEEKCAEKKALSDQKKAERLEKKKEKAAKKPKAEKKEKAESKKTTKKTKTTRTKKMTMTVTQ